MAKADKVSILERHVEKLALLVSVVLFGYAASRWALESPVRLTVIDPSGRRTKANVGPEQVDKVLEQAAMSVKDAYDGAEETVAPVPLSAGHTVEYRHIEPRQSEGLDLGLSQRPVRTDVIVDPSVNLPTLAKIQAAMDPPKRPDIVAGLELPKQDTLEDKLVARGLVLFPIEKLRTAWGELVKDTPIQVPMLAGYAVVVEVQQALPDGTWPKAAKTVTLLVRLDNTEQPVEVPPIPDFDGKNVQSVRDARNKVADALMQTGILRPEYYKIWSIEQDDWGTWRARLPELRAEDGQMPVWFHDDSTMQLGGTYRYRVQVRFINPLLTYEDAVPSKNKKTDPYEKFVSTPFSEWSRPVAVRRQVYFYLTGTSQTTRQMTVTVYAHKWGQIVRNRFRVTPGQPIGGKATVNIRDPLGPKGSTRSVEVDFTTGAVALRFNFRKEMIRRGIPVRTAEMLYMAKDKLLKSRIQALDDNNEQRKKLDAQVEGAR